jgi:hypothetical protein
MYPAAALLAGDWCARALERKEARRTLLWGGGLALGLSAVLLGVIAFSGPIIHAIEASTHKPVRMDQVPDGALRWAGHLFAAAALASGTFVLFATVNRRRTAFQGMVAGMALFYAFAVFEGLPLIDRAVLSPLQNCVRFYSFEASHEDPYPWILKTGSTRRPSLIFYFPDGKIGKPLSAGGIVEITNVPEAIALMKAQGRCRMLVDAPNGERIASATGAKVDHREPGWVVLETTAEK